MQGKEESCCCEGLLAGSDFSSWIVWVDTGSSELFLCINITSHQNQRNFEWLPKYSCRVVRVLRKLVLCLDWLSICVCYCGCGDGAFGQDSWSSLILKFSVVLFESVMHCGSLGLQQMFVHATTSFLFVWLLFFFCFGSVFKNFIIHFWDGWGRSGSE